MECDKFETFFTLHCVFRKNEGDWGNSCKHICRHKESTLTDYHFFQDFSGKFFHSKAVDFSNFLSLYKCRKILTIKTTFNNVAQLSNHRPDHAENLHNHAHVAIFSTDAFKLQISAHKKYALSGLVSLSDKRKIKATVELIFCS